MYVTVTPRDGLALPTLQAPDYTPLDSNQYPTILTQVGFGKFHVGSASNCYIVRLADGTFIVHDSGYGVFFSPSKQLQYGVGEAIYEILKKQAPDPNNIVISAWITTHPHNDHLDGLVAFANKYASYPNVRVKQFAHNFADESYLPKTELNNRRAVIAAAKKFQGATIIKPHTGNVLYYANVKFRILYTVEDHLDLTGGTLYYGNASTMVTQMETDDGVKVLFGGDSSQMEQVYEGTPFTYEALSKWYGSFVESEIMTYFHHGLGGGSSWTANATIKPEIVLWPATWDKINTVNNGTTLLNSGHAVYFTRATQHGTSGGFAEGVLHTTPNYMGVKGWFVADDNLHVLTLKKNNVTVTTYDNFAAYGVGDVADW